MLLQPLKNIEIINVLKISLSIYITRNLAKCISCQPSRSIKLPKEELKHLLKYILPW